MLTGEAKSKGRTKGSGQQFLYAFGMDPLLPLTLNLRDMEARGRAGCAYSPLTGTLHSLSTLPCAQRLTSRDHIATALSCFQVGVASERHHHERRQEGRDEGIVPFLPVLVP